MVHTVRYSYSFLEPKEERIKKPVTVNFTYGSAYNTQLRVIEVNDQVSQPFSYFAVMLPNEF